MNQWADTQRAVKYLHRAAQIPGRAKFHRVVSLLINFHEIVLKNGIHRLVLRDGLEP
jgi:hypothetical protein